MIRGLLPCSAKLTGVLTSGGLLGCVKAYAGVLVPDIAHRVHRTVWGWYAGQQEGAILLEPRHVQGHVTQMQALGQHLVPSHFFVSGEYDDNGTTESACLTWPTTAAPSGPMLLYDWREHMLGQD
eukprot:3426881-Rhodomonas_salina.3